MSAACSPRGPVSDRAHPVASHAIVATDPQAQQALANGLDRLGIDLATPARDALLRYLSLIARWNRVYNLSAIRETGQMLTHHLLDSLAVLPFLRARANGGLPSRPSLIDVGSGAGLPGIPLALAWPELTATLAEPVGKKSAFLRQAVAELGLSDRVKVHAARIETLAAPTPPIDLIICRAFASLHDFTQAIARLASPRTQVWAMKGRLPTDELARLPAPWRLADLHRLEVPRLAAQRHLLRLEFAAEPPPESRP